MTATLDRMTASTSTAQPRFTLRGPEDVLAKVPFLVGFHPRESLVALAFGADHQIRFTIRVDLPGRPARSSANPVATSDNRVPRQSPGVVAPAEVDELVRHLVRVFRKRSARYAVAVAYTTDRAAARPVLDAFRRRMRPVGIDVLDLLVADGRRWWSEGCTDHECCPPEGNLYDLARHPVTAQSVYAGEVALDDEDALRRSVARPDGAAALRMRELTTRTETELRERLAGEADPVSAWKAAGRAHVEDLLRRCRTDPERLTDEEVALASVFVSDVKGRDEIWRLMTRTSAMVHVALWSVVVRRTVTPYDVAPAALLAFSAWLSGNGGLSRCALERAFASDPSYPMAGLVEQLLAGAVPPDQWSRFEETW